MKERGIFVAFEGVDGAGKTLQANLLLKALFKQGLRATYVREPGGTLVGEEIRKLLKRFGPSLDVHTEALLFAASRTALSYKISSLQQQGVHVICDRWVLSSFVYQMLAGEEFITEINAQALKIAVPDVVFILDPMYGAIAYDRIRKRNQQEPVSACEDWEQVDYLQLLVDAYSHTDWHRLLPSCKFVHLLVGSATPEEVHQTVWKVIEPLVKGGDP